MAKLLTLSQLAEMLQLPQHVINRALVRYGPTPADRIGTTRVWPSTALAEIRRSVERTQGDHRSHTSYRRRAEAAQKAPNAAKNE
jgi:hypothetical protein